MKQADLQCRQWHQSVPRGQMVADIKALDPTGRLQRFAIGYGKPDHIDDEVVVTLMLDAQHAGQARDAQTFACELLRRVTRHVRAHVRKNPGWQQLGGGSNAVMDDFCGSIVLAILADETVPCHAEQAFGNYVWRRCLDEAAKLHAKKHSTGQSFDDEGEAAVDAMQVSGGLETSVLHLSPEQILIAFEGMSAENDLLDKIRRIVQQDLPEREKLAFSYRYYAGLKIDSKKADEVTITRLMGLTEKTVTKYINQAIDMIKQGLKNE